MALYDLQKDFILSTGPVQTTKPIIPVLRSQNGDEIKEPNGGLEQDGMLPTAEAPSAPDKASVKMGFQSKPKNVFAAVKKNALAGKKVVVLEQPKKISEAERIMKEEMERKRKREASASGESAQKRQRS